jgi:ferredoxin/flavodoxin
MRNPKTNMRMNTEIYYFTGTGNSYIVAKDIADRLKGNLIAIKDTEYRERIILNTGITGIVFPAYYMRLPRIIERFVNKLENLENKYLFAIVTVGGIAGKVFNRFQEALKTRGGKLSGAFVVRMPANYIDTTDSLPGFLQKRMFRNWGKKVDNVVSYIKNSKHGKIENFNPIGTFLFANYIEKEFNTGLFLPDIDRNFWTDNKCNLCGVCSKICPVNNIIIENKSILWKGNCEKCLACIQWCPETAIQFGDKTIKRKRYHHPDVTLIEMIRKN